MKNARSNQTATIGSLGVGLAFNPALADFVVAHRDAIDYLELSPERFWHDRGPQWGCQSGRYTEIPEAVVLLDKVRADLPLLAHGVGLSIATAGPLDRGHVEQLARWHRRYNFEWISEHLAYFRLGPQASWRGIGVMLPPVYDAVVLHDLQNKLEQMCDILALEVLLENTVNYTPVADAQCSEAEFLNAVAKRTPAHLLLDLHNLYTNSINHGDDAFITIDALDLTQVYELHIAGGAALAGYWTDAHAGRCPAQVWTLLEYVLSRPNAIRAITFEIDESYATQVNAGVILNEIEHARALWNAAHARQSETCR